MSLSDDLDWRGRARRGPDGLPRPARQKRASVASPLSVGGRLRVARGVPQAVLKVLSYRRGRDAVRRTLAYVVGKAGERFVVEGDVELEGGEARAAVLDDWSRDFSTRANGRDILHMQLSAPPGSDRAQLLAAARAFAAETFGATHQYALAEHRDTGHPHCHLLLKLKGHDGRMLDPRKATLARWRETFAAAARAQGLMLDASPRIARGAPPRSRSRARIALEQSGETHAPGKSAQARSQDRSRGDTTSVSARLRLERDAFHEAALTLARTAEDEIDPAGRRRYRSMARELIAYGDQLGAGRDAEVRAGMASGDRGRHRADAERDPGD